MIRYALSCADDHSFESWFQSAEAFDRLLVAGMISCTVCGSTSVTKTLMAPAVRPARKAAAGEAPLSKPASKAEEALAAMRRQIEQNSDYVGLNFAAEARAMHEGEAPERSIYGEARVEDAKRLIKDGIPVAPLPFMPARKTN
ncbi:DUF1178 family protein [Defluviimonas sp. D31]|uniref:DUF1178 family protein n=1 Tax=Defluviimonas sp. D31 TaxID=3083253 RepID=UPI00296EA151|nr:DUF1178 family protein [Defluviimonas sp. D31]MDW4548288.1 DUF1178 family protein [Defluviimonas sp. D31]